MNTTHASLIERLCQPGEPDAWERFVELYTPLIYYWGRRMELQPREASDLVQDVFAFLVQKLPEFTYDRHKSFRNWLRTVTLNKWRETLRRRANLPADTPGDSFVDLGDINSAFEGWEAEYRQHLVGQALRLLQADFQPAVWKAFWEHVARRRPAADVAAELGVSVGAIHAAKFRVLSRLRHELDGLME